MSEPDLALALNTCEVEAGGLLQVLYQPELQSHSQSRTHQTNPKPISECVHSCKNRNKVGAWDGIQPAGCLPNPQSGPAFQPSPAKTRHECACTPGIRALQTFKLIPGHGKFKDSLVRMRPNFKKKLRISWYFL